MDWSSSRGLRLIEVGEVRGCSAVHQVTAILTEPQEGWGFWSEASDFGEERQQGP
jgi:hypothetical protein